MATSGAVRPSDDHCLKKLYIPDLVLTGGAINFSGGFLESIGQFSIAPTSFGTGTVPVGGGWYSADGTAPADPLCAGSSKISFSWAGQGVTSLLFSYGTPAAALVAGAYVQFSSAAYGTILFKEKGFAPRILPGSRGISSPLTGGGFAVLTHVSGPNNGNAPVFLDTSCGNPSPGVIGLHESSASVTDIPINMRIDFYQPACP